MNWDWVHSSMKMCREIGIVAPRIVVSAKLFNRLLGDAIQNHFYFESEGEVSKLRSHIYLTVIVCGSCDAGIKIESSLRG